MMCSTNNSLVDTDRINIRYVIDSILNKDISIWDSHPGLDEGVMGWVDLTGHQDIQKIYGEWDSIYASLSEYTHIVFIGFGGSILGGQLLNSVMSPKPDIKICYLDTINPEEMKEVKNFIRMPTTLFIVASKSGTTLETRSLERFFFKYLNSRVSHSETGNNFFAITDPGSDLDHLAAIMRYKKVIYGDPSVGGRFSALTAFGLFPTYLMGTKFDSLDLIFQALSEKIVQNTTFYDDTVELIHFMAECLKNGRDKLTIKVPPELDTLALWIEQLLSESLGKDGKGMILIIKEHDMDVDAYSRDRAFLFIETKGDQVIEQDGRIMDLMRANFPTLHIRIEDIKINIASEIFKWQIAVATLGNLLGINPFDQPKVEKSKMLTRNLLAEVASGKIIVKRNGVSISEFLHNCRPGDYIGVLAYLPRRAEMEKLLDEIRIELTRITGVPTTLGYGPSYLHSTGQLHKGGPKNGRFIQITYDLPCDIPVPGEHFSFGDILMAQAEGDFAAMVDQNIPITKCHLGNKKCGGLRRLLNDLREKDCNIKGCKVWPQAHDKACH